MKAIREADIIHVHNFHGGQVSLRSLRELLNVKPVVWTLHDMWPITGHCAYSLDCERWMTGCGKCPYMSAYPAIMIDTSAFLWQYKKEAFQHVSPSLVTPSKWLKNMTARSILSHCKSRVIPNAVDDTVFYPASKAKSREELGLPIGDFTLLFAVHGGRNNPWKGYDYAAEALKYITKGNKKVTLICLGNRRETDSLLRDNTNIKNIGYVSSESLMRTYYSAADAYLLPSIADNSPLGIIESLACGTPVIAFDVGGIPELISHLETGYIAKYKNAEDLSNGIKWLMDLPSDSAQDISQICAQTAKQRHSLQMQMINYLDVYQQAQCERSN